MCFCVCVLYAYVSCLVRGCVRGVCAYLASGGLAESEEQECGFVPYN